MKTFMKKQTLKFDAIANIFTSLWSLGYETKNIFSILEGPLTMFGLQIEFQNWDRDWTNLDKARIEISTKINKINDQISSVNKNIKILNHDFNDLQIKRIEFNKKRFKEYFHKIFETIKLEKGNSNRIMPHIRNSLTVLIRGKMDVVYIQSREVLSRIILVRDYFVKNVTIPNKYSGSVNEVVDLYLIGYRKTALMCLGRIFEEIFTKYLLRLKRQHVIKKTIQDIECMKFENKISYLYSIKKISHKDWTIFSKLVWDRNVGAHYSKKREQVDTEQEAKETIKLAINLLNKYYNLIELL